MVDQQSMPPPMGQGVQPQATIASPPQQMQPPVQQAMPAQQAPGQASPAPMGANATPTFPQAPGMQTQESGSTIEEIEQVVETIIDERWKEVTENIKKVLDWKASMEEKFIKMEEDVKNVRADFTDLQKAIVGKVGDYDKNILNVNAELQAIEKVFAQTLPAFTANVNELSRISEDLKGVHRTKKSEK